MATKKNKLVFDISSANSLSCGYTRVRIMPRNYNKIVSIASITGKTIQDTVDILVEYALNNCEVKLSDGKTIDFSNM